MLVLALASPLGAAPAPATAPATLRLASEEVRHRWVEVTPLSANAAVMRIVPEESATLVSLVGAAPGLALVCAGGEAAATRCTEAIVSPGGAIGLSLTPGGVRTTGAIFIGRKPAAGALVSVVPEPLIARRGFTLPLERGASGELVREVRCDGAGRFAIPLLPPGTFHLEVRTAGGRADHGRAFTVPDPAALRRKEDAPAKPSQLDLGIWSLDEGVALEVGFFDSEGRPIAGASVGAMQRTRGGAMLEFEAHAGSDGLAELSRVDPDLSLHLNCVAPGFVTLQKELPSPAPGVRCDLERVAAIAGTVLDAGDKPIQDARITLRRAGRAVTSGKSGGFSIEALEPGRYRVVAATMGFHAAERDVTLAAGERKSLSPFHLAAADEIIGRVLDAESDEPVPGAAVEVSDPPGGGSTDTDEDGRFALKTGADDPLTMSITASGYPVKRLQVASDQRAGEPLVARLSRGGKIRVSVWSDELEAPCVGCSVTVTSSGGDVSTLVTSPEGDALSDPLDPGIWRVALLRVESLGSVVTVQGGDSACSVSVSQGKTTPVVFGRRSTVRVSFSPSVAAGWSLTARAGSSLSSARQEPDGSFSVRRKPGEAITLSLSGPGFGEVRQAVLPADFDEPAITLPLHPTLVRGRLLQGQEPLSGADLTLVAVESGSAAASIQTGLEGDFALQYVLPGVYIVLAEGKPLRTVQVEEDKSVDLGPIVVSTGAEPAPTS